MQERGVDVTMVDAEGDGGDVVTDKIGRSKLGEEESEMKAEEGAEEAQGRHQMSGTDAGRSAGEEARAGENEDGQHGMREIAGAEGKEMEVDTVAGVQGGVGMAGVGAEVEGEERENIRTSSGMEQNVVMRERDEHKALDVSDGHCGDVDAAGDMETSQDVSKQEGQGQEKASDEMVGKAPEVDKMRADIELRKGEKGTDERLVREGQIADGEEESKGPAEPSTTSDKTDAVVTDPSAKVDA